ncbi:bifunctional tRNA (5-methylaminomethyl-2-thiouridine)(34)-methyltransferase MnmD/FAD-dependent 5-carboxymethylaminomethyl-2-thiouridine(34) oxidoreductase MnmC [Marinobacter halophilus]|uniref:tRNA 5-methylaminomethyl-2-thiouridine biosynthesis bifunctional protein MnmC n=1 Tax=Marinobacter halophilus TaxID=1323740 RepID=A0A2T1KI93_9GAMM|nr:bifunctional tRNA (5-methylaminomethyl-2-thiouridine)(34)-methyltransferase MnmD/FAD-dependent 5-carboxymethylaminomethyl-2-thiouridine(34) oxidoreductase MnmC [Marinobacter halophilus]PSF09443.1 bifunctional tRNA (5-methylaminomethyl-2-thiouridine)(34)-methyltransferase MnmD/FAD-dependent 5-carboxymethylaminomethyl-2-thiouridine(34) oxidoreductase MnmC [Marinobacter halophilus]GGC77753.1 tRNA 5-methylaminomethyl-2-thiouridine biosynthesis bifunctional protein MnmC [Marinobacter halophilus]
MHERPLPPAMEPAELTWHDDVPESVRFGDVYFNRDNGLAESRHVFIGPSHLPERFRQVPSLGHFVVAETGFGTGLNFLTTWLEWLAQRPANDNAILHFVSVERYPLTRTDLEKALSHWPELNHQAAELIAHYPSLISGTHRLILAGGKIRLTLYFGDVLNAWQDLTFTADAWFLDGFSPSQNPAMWHSETIKQIAKHSKTGTTLTTFTAVSQVRRVLADAGFDMKILGGFDHKRDMLAGRFTAEMLGEASPSVDQVAVIGAGIAGTLLARNLAERGISVLLIDQAEKPGSAASGNPQGALYVKLGVEYNAQTELAATALSFSQRYYGAWQSDFWHPTGLLQLASSPQEVDRQRRFCERNTYPSDLMRPVDARQATELAGIAIEHPGLWFPGSGWLAPATACQQLADHPLIETRFNYQIASIQPCNSQWSIRNSKGEDRQIAKVVIAGGHEAAKLVPVPGELRLKPIRGQTTQLPAPRFNLPRTVICGTKYLNPVNGGHATTGATFDLRDDNPTPTTISNQQNLEEVTAMLPAVSIDNTLDADQLEGRVAFRCTTHDYQPVAGLLHDKTGDPVDGIYLMTGLGSKGLVWAPLLAEYLTDMITNQPRCLSKRLAKRLETGRLYRT